MSHRISDIQRMRLGEQVVLKVKVLEVRPSFYLGDLPYDRYLVSDDTGKVTVIMPSANLYLLPRRPSGA